MDKWLKGRAFPADADALCVVLAQIHAAASRAGLSAGDLQLVESSPWRERHRQVLARQQHEAEVLQRGRQATGGLSAAEMSAKWRTLSDPPRPVHSWTAEHLGVHPSISGTFGDDPAFVLPTYVPRTHDDRLRNALQDAAAGTEPVLVLVRGGSCTGKTRAAAEALHAVPELADWQLTRPATPTSILEVLDAGVLEARAVLFLDDAHHLLRGPEGETLAAALLSRLNRHPGPAIILATLWDDAYDALTAPPPTKPLGDDPHRHSRVLMHRAQRIDVPTTFTGEALRTLTAQAADDPALTQAQTTAPTGKITQTLAAGVQLLDRYTRALQPPDCYSRALITAAMDATRLGWTDPLPEAFLRSAAPGYLDDEQRAAASDDWFANALLKACEKVERVAAPLDPVPRTEGMGPQPGVWNLNDYLDQHGRRHRQRTCPPPAFWEAALAHLDSAAGLVTLGKAAFSRWRLRYAADLLNKAAEAGGPEPLMELSWIAVLAMNMPAAVRFLMRAAQRGSVEALRQLAWRVEADVANRILEHLADLGDTKAQHRLAQQKRDSGDTEGAMLLFRQAAEAGDTQALQIVVTHHKEQGDRKGAEALLRQAVVRGNIRAVLDLALLLEEAGSDEEAERLLLDAGRTGEPEALVSLAWRRAEAGDWDAVEVFLREAAERGAAETWLNLAEMHEHAGHPDIALNVYKQAAEEGVTQAMLMLADSLKSSGHLSEAEQWYQRAADAGNLDAFQSIFRIRMESGDAQGAQDVALLAADAGDTTSFLLLSAQGDDERIRAMRMYGLEADGHPSHPWAL